MVESISCPHCGNRYPIDYDYLEQFGNTKTLCRACGVRFILPRLEEVFPVPPIIVGSPQSTVQYASPLTPQAPGTTHGVWRDHDDLILERGAELPRRCICCNDVGDGKRLWIKLWWKEREKPSIVLAVLSKPKEDMIAFRFSLCAGHRHKLQQSRQLGNLLMLSGLFVFFAAMLCSLLFDWKPALIWPGAAVVFVTGLVWRSFGALSLAAVTIDDHEARVTGFGKAFVASLESREEARARLARSTQNLLERLAKQ